MPKIKIIIEVNGEIKTLEGDHVVVVSQSGGDITLNRIESDTVTSLGLLEVGQLHIRKEWELNNSK